MMVRDVCLPVLGMLLVGGAVEAGCPCNKHGGGVGYTSAALTPMPEMGFAGVAPPIQPWAAGPGPATMPPYAAPQTLAAAPGVDRFGMSPPPGNLGRTYKVRTRPVDKDLHPRMGVLEVSLPESADVTADGLKPSWTGEKWVLKTEEPMLPGLPQIYAVKAKFDRDGQTVTEYRWVRLILGRVVELSFD